MFKKILVLVFLSFLISCGGSRSGIKTTKNGTAKGRATTARKKPAIRTKTETKTASSNSSDGRTTEVLESSSRTVVYSDLVKQYVLDFKDVAKDNMKRHGIPASIILAQGILESGAGRGTLCVNANNHFGIKCHADWTGETVNHDDDAEQECFRKYKQASESYNDHSLFLTTRGRYASLFKITKGDYVAWAKGLKAAGYATDPKYPEKLIGLIERYNLADYDDEVLGGNYRPVKQPVPQATKPAVVLTPEKTIIAPAEGNALPATDSHKVAQGETLYSISKKHNLTVDQLMQLNGLENNAIAIGQVLKVK